jgi:branched-chain amino acid transport system ATP-binding protein
MNPMLSFENVNVSIADAPVLRNVSFALEPGVSAALVGRNGAGKTTTVRTIMGFTKANGALRLDGADLGSVPPHRRPSLGVGYAPEDRRLFSAFTVKENILLPGRVAGLSASEMRQRLERAYSVLPELEQIAQRPAGSISGGQGKMVALGRALMLGTRLIILDEPFQGLAPVLAQRYAEALRRLRSADKNITLLITESNPKLLETFADVMFTIERGEIASTRRPRQP